MAGQNPATGAGPDEATLSANPVSNIPADRAEGVLSLLKLTPHDQPSSMGDLINQHHQTRLANAQMYSNAAKTALHSQLLIQHGIDPDTGTRFDDPAYKGPSAEDQAARYQANYNEAWTNYKKLAGVDQNTKGALAKAEQILNHVLGGGAMQSAPGAPSNQGRPGGMTPPPQSGGSPQATVMDSGVSLTPPPSAQADQNFALSAPMIEANTQFQQNINRGLQSEQAQFKQGIAQRKDVAENVLHLDPKSREYDYYVGTGKMPPVFRPPRPAGVYTVSVLDAAKRVQNGEAFLDTNGDPIDVSKLDPTMGLKGMQVLDPNTNEWTVRYEPFSPNQSTVNVGNEVYAVSPMDKSKLVTGAGTALGPQHVATTSTHTAPGVTLGGEIGTVTTGTTKTPATVGIPGRTQAAPVGTAPATPRPGGISTPPVPQGSIGQPGATRKSGAATVPIASATPRVSSNEQAIPFGAANQLNQRIIPVREAATQLFGDPTQPDFKGFQEYASLADNKNKDERDALANAVRLTLDHMKGEERSAGSLTTLLGNYLGKPQALVDSETSVMKDTIGKLSPQNQEAYNAIMSVYGTVMGLRSLTRASSHQFSVEALEREIPLPGINAFSKQQFYDKMSRLAEQVYNGSKTVPLPQKEKDFYAGKVKEYRQLAGGRSGGITPAPTVEGSSAAPKTADDYLAKFGIKLTGQP